MPYLLMRLAVVEHVLLMMLSSFYHCTWSRVLCLYRCPRETWRFYEGRRRPQHTVLWMLANAAFAK